MTMSEQGTPLSRRRFLAGTALGASPRRPAASAAPAVLRAQGAGVKVGVLHPVTGALAYSGQQCRVGAHDGDRGHQRRRRHQVAGRRQDRGGAGRRAVDAGGRHRRGREDEFDAGVAAIVGGYASSICLATTQAAANYNLPHVVDVGVADQIVNRGLKNTFRFGPGYGVIAETALANLHLNNAAGKPAKTVMIVHEDSLFGSGTAKLLTRNCREHGFEVKETIKHPTPTRDFNNIVLQDQGAEPGHRDPGQLLQRIRAAGAHHAAAEGDARRRSTRCSAAPPRATSSSRSSRTRPTTSSTATTGSTRRTQGAGAEEAGRGARASSSPTRCS